MIVYKASELGACTKFLVCSRLGFEIPPLYAVEEDGSPLKIFERGHRVEAEVIEWLKEQGYTILSQQEEYYIGAGQTSDGEDIVIQCHPDARARNSEGVETAVEIKSATDESYNEFKNKGWEYAGGLWPRYRYQGSCYSIASGLPLTVVVRNIERGTTLISYDDSAPPLYTKSQLLARVKRVEGMVENYDIPDACDYPNRLCPLKYMHESEDEFAENPELDELVAEYVAIRDEINNGAKKGATRRLALRAKIGKAMGVDLSGSDDPKGGKSHSIDTGHSKVSINWGPTSHATVDWEKMKQDGVDVGRYKKPQKYGYRVMVWDRKGKKRKDSN